MIDQRDEPPTSATGVAASPSDERSPALAEPESQPRLRIWETVVLALLFLVATAIGSCASGFLIRLEEG